MKLELTEQQLKSINQLLAFNSLKPTDVEAINAAIEQANLPTPTTEKEREGAVKILVKLYAAQWVTKISAATSQTEFESLSKEAFEKHKNFKSLWASMRNDITNAKPRLTYEDTTNKSLKPHALIKLTLKQIESANYDQIEVHNILKAFLDNSKDTKLNYKKYLPQLNELNMLLETNKVDYRIIYIIQGYFKLMLEEYKFVTDIKKIDVYINNIDNLEQSIKANMRDNNSSYTAKLLAKIYDLKLTLNKEFAIREYSANSKSTDLKNMLFTAEKLDKSVEYKSELEYFQKLASFLRNELKMSLTESEIADIHKLTPTTDSIEEIEVTSLVLTKKQRPKKLL